MATKLTGLSIATTCDPIETYHQLGGPGRVYNKALAIPMHLGHPWHSIEFVTIPPGHNGVGLHQQTTDEIYVIVSGQGELLANGQPALVEAGMLACAPAGTIHALTNTSATEALTLLVVELATSPDAPSHQPSLYHLFSQLREAEDITPAYQDLRPTPPVRATINLRPLFSAPWDTFSLMALPPGYRVDPSGEPECDQLLFVMSGFATFLIGQSRQASADNPLSSDDAQPIRIDADGQFHQSVLVPRGIACGYINRASGDYPLMVVRLTVRRAHQQHIPQVPLPSPIGQESAKKEVGA